ncbi:MAG: hypothetical protein IT159_06920 [Bryobacterales bacterium]|nr:hypothetical protein [Bryobacterales bacterium]
MVSRRGFIGSLAAHRLASAAAGAGEVRLARDGTLRLRNGRLFCALGGFHANVLPLSRLKLSGEEMERVRPYVWSAQKTDGQGHVDLWDASDQMMDQWFRQLAADGVTALRLFARARVGNDVLDLCGKLNPELRQVFHRAYAVARPYGIRFLQQILPEPGSSCYVSRGSIERRVLPRYSASELETLTPAQARFLKDGKRVTLQESFTDPDVLACQKLYLEQAMDWIATEPQVFAVEIYNEQGWNGRQYQFPVEDAEIRWSKEIVDTIRRRLPRMLVTLSHPGFGITGYDPFKWVRGAGVDFYSPHAYAGISGESAAIDFAAVTAASSLIMNAGLPSFYGEWGVFNSPVPLELKRFSHRDALWLCLMNGETGFMQWTNEFPEEFRWPSRIMRALPADFSPAPPELAVGIGETYRRFQDNTRYAAFAPGEFPGFELNREKQRDENIQRIFAAYQRSLDTGVPIRFDVNGKGRISLPDFAGLDLSRRARPIQAVGGYQARYLKDAHNPLWLAYLRKRKVQAFGSHYVGVPEPAPLEIRLRLPAGRYTARLLNLSAGKLETSSVDANHAFKVSPNTSSDYVVLISGSRVRIDL